MLVIFVCQVMSTIPEYNRNLFEYICTFCRTLLQLSDKNRLNANLLGNVLSVFFFLSFISWLEEGHSTTVAAIHQKR